MGRSGTHAGCVVLNQTVAVDVLLRMVTGNTAAFPLRPIYEPRVESSHSDCVGMGRCGLHLSRCLALRWPQPGCDGWPVTDSNLDVARRWGATDCHGGSPCSSRASGRSRN